MPGIAANNLLDTELIFPNIVLHPSDANPIKVSNRILFEEPHFLFHYTYSRSVVAPSFALSGSSPLNI